MHRIWVQAKFRKPATKPIVKKKESDNDISDLFPPFGAASKR